MERPLGIGFVGTGKIARVHAHALRTLMEFGSPRPIRLVSVTGRDRSRYERIASDFGFARTAASIPELVEADDIDIVAILSSDELHTEGSRLAIEAGKAIMCEKPLTVEPSEADELAALARLHGVPNAVCYNYRYVPALKLARDLFTTGRLGTIRQVRAVYFQEWARRNQKRRGWKFENASLGRAIEDYSHLLDTISYLGAEPASVAATISTLGNDGVLRPAEIGESIEDSYQAIMRLTNGGVASVEASRVATGWHAHHGYEVVGTMGSLAWDMEDINHLSLYDPGSSPSPGSRGFSQIYLTSDSDPFSEMTWLLGHPIGWEHTFTYMWADFIHSLSGQGGAHVFADFEQGARIMHIADSIRHAAKEGAWVDVV